MIRRIITIVIDVVSVAIIICAAVIMLSVVFTKSGDVPKIGGYSLMCVISGSMEPEIPVNSLVLVKEASPEEIRQGDVISFYSTDPVLDGAIVTHRVAEIISDDGGSEFKTKGDANGYVDEYTASGKDVIGKVVFISPGAGILVKLSANPLIFILLILIPLAVMLILIIRQTVVVACEIEKEEQEEALRKMIAQIKAQQEADALEQNSGKLDGDTDRLAGKDELEQ